MLSRLLITRILSIMLLCVMFFGISADINAEENPWYHVEPLNSGPVSVLIDFQHMESSYYDGYKRRAFPLWINVRRQDLGPSDVVHVMLINYFQKNNSAPFHKIVFEGDLNYIESGHFAGTSLELLLYHRPSDNLYTVQACWQEIVVWINGELYKDPATGNNLGFNIQDFIK